MASTINIPKSHLIMALCLPVAVLLGYFLADPLDSGSLAVFILLMSVLAVPLMMKWHQPLLVLSWNIGITSYVLPGHPDLWMIMAMLALFFAALNRSVSAEHTFIYVPPVTNSLLFLLAVVLLTAFMTGGIGLRAMGSNTYGGRKYLNIVAAIAGYFALTSRRVPANRAGLYVAMFFLPCLTSLIGNLAYIAGPKFYFLLNVFDPAGAIEQAQEESRVTDSLVRYYGLIDASRGVYCYLLARYGVKGVLDISKPWRIFFLALAVAGTILGGFRTSLVVFVMVFGCVFWLEGLWRTRWLPILAGAAVLTLSAALPVVDKLPLAAQRTLSFLPVQVDPLVRLSADISVDWRVEMWKLVWPEVPKHLLKGKGYAMDPNELYMAGFGRAGEGSLAASILAEDYHNGPLSVVVPFGLVGVAGLIWFWVASLRYLYHHYRYGDPALKEINTFFLGYYISSIVLFIAVFGGISTDLWRFTGIIGLAVCLNGATASEAIEEMAGEGAGAETAEAVY